MDEIFYYTCPYCGDGVDGDLGITTGLGPPVRRCDKCGEAYETKRQEWDDIELGQKLWYVFLSFIYVGASAFFGIVSIRGAYHIWHGGGSQMTLEGPGYDVGLVLGVLLVGGIQVFRVFASQLRTKGARGEPFESTVMNLQVMLLPKVFVLFALPPLVSWLVSSVS